MRRGVSVHRHRHESIAFLGRGRCAGGCAFRTRLAPTPPIARGSATRRAAPTPPLLPFLLLPLQLLLLQQLGTWWRRRRRRREGGGRLRQCRHRRNRPVPPRLVDTVAALPPGLYLLETVCVGGQRRARSALRSRAAKRAAAALGPRSLAAPALPREYAAAPASTSVSAVRIARARLLARPRLSFSLGRERLRVPAAAVCAACCATVGLPAAVGVEPTIARAATAAAALRHCATVRTSAGLSAVCRRRPGAAPNKPGAGYALHLLPETVVDVNSRTIAERATDVSGSRPALRTCARRGVWGARLPRGAHARAGRWDVVWRLRRARLGRRAHRGSRARTHAREDGTPGRRKVV